MVHLRQQRVHKYFVWVCMACAGASCFGRRIVPISGPVDGFDKPSDRAAVGSRPPQNSTSPQVYLRHEEILIEDNSPPSDAGSIFNLEDGRNYLYPSDTPTAVGTTITVEIRSNRKDSNEKADKKAAKGKDSDVSKELAENPLWKAFPDLEPDSGEAVPIKRFKMKVTHRLANGDVLAMFRRHSISGSFAQTIIIKARIPYDRVGYAPTITTDDLADIDWLENTGQELVERKSSSWEDEYTLRLSGFDEAKSKAALAIDDKRKALMSIRDQLKTQLRSFTEERSQMAKQRADLLEAQKRDGEEIAKMKKDAEEKTSLLDKAQEELKSLKEKAEEAKSEVKEAADKAKK
jgi:hypothetical protein